MKVAWWAWALLGLVVLGGVLALLASPLPDGLDTTIERLGLPTANAPQPAPLPGYATPGVRQPKVSAFVAAGLGVVMVFVVTVLLGKLMGRRKA